jgi:hypothetical protein
MFYKFGPILCPVGLILIALAIIGNLASEDVVSLKVSLTRMALGTLVFALGCWLVYSTYLRKNRSEPCQERAG